MNHGDLHLNKGDVKLLNLCITSVQVTTHLNCLIMMVVVAMPTNLRRKIYANTSAKCTVRETTFYLLNCSVIELNFLKIRLTKKVKETV